MCGGARRGMENQGKLPSFDTSVPPKFSSGLSSYGLGMEEILKMFEAFDVHTQQ